MLDVGIGRVLRDIPTELCMISVKTSARYHIKIYRTYQHFWYHIFDDISKRMYQFT